MAILKNGLYISETTPRRATISSMRAYVQFREQKCATFSLLYQNCHADLDFAYKFCVLVFNKRKLNVWMYKVFNLTEHVTCTLDLL